MDEFVGDRIINLYISLSLEERGYDLILVKGLFPLCSSNSNMVAVSSQELHTKMSGDEFEVMVYQLFKKGDVAQIKRLADRLVDNIIHGMDTEFITSCGVRAHNSELEHKAAMARKPPPSSAPMDGSTSSVLEFLQKSHKLVEFQSTQIGGGSHDPVFEVTMKVSDGFSTTVTSTSKKEGRALACLNACAYYRALSS